MQTLVNGEPTETISVQDRGFQYGDGCFETIRLENNRLTLRSAHLARLQNTCTSLGITLDQKALDTDLDKLLAANKPIALAVLKITITRGLGGRGYKPLETTHASRIVQLFPFPDNYGDNATQGVNVIYCKHRLSNSSALAGLKHLNRLDQVLASRELGADEAEGLCLDQGGNIIEATRSNILLAQGGLMVTPKLTNAGVAGVMLNYLIRRFQADGVKVEQRELKPNDLREVDEVLLCNSVFGIWPVIKLRENDNLLSWPLGPKYQQALRYQHEAFTASD